MLETSGLLCAVLLLESEAEYQEVENFKRNFLPKFLLGTGRRG